MAGQGEVSGGEVDHDGDGRAEVVHHRRQGLPEDGGEDLEGERGSRVSLENKERTLLSGSSRQDARNCLADLVERRSSQTEATGYF